MAVAKGETYAEHLTDILIKQKSIKPEEGKAIKKAFKESDQDIFDEFLIDEGLVEEDDLLAALSKYYQVPSFDVVGYFFDTFLLQQFPKDLLLRCEMIPLEVDENILIMIAAEPNAPDLLDIIGENVSYDVHFYVGISRNIRDAIQAYYEQSDTDPVANQDIDLREQRRLTRQELSMEDQAEDVVLYTEDEET